MLQHRTYFSLCRLRTTPPFRLKKYYRSWQIPYCLEDRQTLSRSQLIPYEAWNEEWKKSGLPKTLQPFDIDRLPAHIKTRSRTPSKQFFPSQARQELSFDYKRRLFGRYGFLSGVDPGTLFVDEKSISWEKSVEQANEPNVLQVIEAAAQKRDLESKQIDELMNTIHSNLKKMPEMIEKHQAKQMKDNLASKTQEEKHKAVMEEARDRFGYYVDPRDPKFIKLRIEMDEREKLARKQQRRKK